MHAFETWARIGHLKGFKTTKFFTLKMTAASFLFCFDLWWRVIYFYDVIKV